MLVRLQFRALNLQGLKRKSKRLKSLFFFHFTHFLRTRLQKASIKEFFIFHSFPPKRRSDLFCRVTCVTLVTTERKPCHSLLHFICVTCDVLQFFYLNFNAFFCKNFSLVRKKCVIPSLEARAIHFLHYENQFDTQGIVNRLLLLLLYYFTYSPLRGF